MRGAPEHRLLVIGGGVAGLTAGCYAARAGYRTTILEMGEVPGGLCTSWRRKGYLFDGSVAGLAGTAPEAPVCRLWQDIGVIDHCPLHDPDDFGCVVGPDGRTVTVYTDIDRLEAHLLDAFPLDASTIQEFAQALRACRQLDIPFRSGEGLAGLAASARTSAHSLRSLPAVLKYGRVTLREFTRRLRDPFCYQVFNSLVHFGGPDVPLLTVLLPIAYADRRMTGIPRHGWLAFARAIERRLLDRGGEIRYASRVVRLVSGEGAVAGVVLGDGTVVTGDRVLSAADGHFTHTVLLGETDDGRFDPVHLSDQPVQVNLGVVEEWSGPAVTYLLPGRPQAAGRRQPRITVHHKHYDPQAAAPGRSALTVFLESSYTFWKDLKADRSASTPRSNAAQTSSSTRSAGGDRDLPDAWRWWTCPRRSPGSAIPATGWGRCRRGAPMRAWSRRCFREVRATTAPASPASTRPASGWRAGAGSRRRRSPGAARRARSAGGTASAFPPEGGPRARPGLRKRGLSRATPRPRRRRAPRGCAAGGLSGTTGRRRCAVQRGFTARLARRRPASSAPATSMTTPSSAPGPGLYSGLRRSDVKRSPLMSFHTTDRTRA